MVVFEYSRKKCSTPAGAIAIGRTAKRPRRKVWVAATIMKIHERSTDEWRDDEEEVQSVPEDHTSVPDGSPERGRTHRGRKTVSRRKLFAGIAGAGVAVAAGGGYVLRQQIAWNDEHKGLEKWPGWKPNDANLQLPSHGPLSIDSQVGHLLRRAGFGATSAELKEYASLGYQGALERLLNFEDVADDELETRLNNLGLDLEETNDQQRWWLLRMAWSKRPLREKMTLFWHGYFTSSYRDVGKAERMLVQNQFLRQSAFDTFDNLLTGITADPAMLVYLDLTNSQRNNPNENYARELMELFTVGLGHYTQQDVSEAAVALTGWRVQNDTATSYYSEERHDPREKVFMGQTGYFNYRDIITILVNHQATPWFLCRKLFTFFVYENPSNEDLKPLVEAYVTSGHSMKEVMRALFLSPQFFSERAYRSRIKSPIEFVVGAYRALDVVSSGKELRQLTVTMGQEVFDPPNVAGWPGDKNSSVWVNTGTWMGRLNYVDRLLLGGGGDDGTPPLYLQDIINANQLDTAERFVDFYVHFLLDGKIDSDRRQQFIDYFNGRDIVSNTQLYLTSGQAVPLNRVRGTLYLILGTPEYQLN